MRPGLLALLDQLTGTPAQVLSDLGDVLAQNALASTLFGDICPSGDHDHEWDHNITWRWFHDARLRLAFPAEDQRLVLLTAPPGSITAERLDLLRVVGTETFAFPAGK